MKHFLRKICFFIKASQHLDRQIFKKTCFNASKEEITRNTTYGTLNNGWPQSVLSGKMPNLIFQEDLLRHFYSQISAGTEAILSVIQYV